ncbi:MAG: hypothetical protein Tsb0021_15220 [Chlamydiales bacterium]
MNVPSEAGRQIFAKASSLSYLGGAAFPFVFGWMMDNFLEAWRWIFFGTSLISLGLILIQSRITVPLIKNPLNQAENSLLQTLIHPWKNVWSILKQRRDFLHFQLAFMLGGFGLMIMKPALPQFVAEHLRLSYTEIGVAIALCKGIGYAATSNLWGRWMGMVNIYTFIACVTLMAALFPLGIILSEKTLTLFYGAWVIYGIMQAGSEMGWKMSGPIFSGAGDSSQYSTVNVLMVGIRGCIAPPLGALLVSEGFSFEMMILSSLLCLFACLYSILSSRFALHRKLRIRNTNAFNH